MSRPRSRSLLSHSEHTLCSLGNQLFLCLPVSMASLCSLSLYLIYLDVWVRSSAGLRLVSVSRVSQVSKSQN